MRSFLAVMLLFLASAFAHAHPVPKDNHDRTIVVRLTATGVVVDYRLEVDAARAWADLPEEEQQKLKRREDLPSAYLRHLAPLIAANLDARLDGLELEFRCVESRCRETDSILCDYRLEGRWDLQEGRRHAFTFRDDNFRNDRVSALHLSLAISPSLKGESIVVPEDSALRLSGSGRDKAEDEALRKASATIQAAPESFPGRVRPALPPETGLRGANRPWAAKAKPLAGVPEAVVRLGTYDDPAETTTARGWSLLGLLLDTKQGMAVLLLMAALFGAAHALTPGHGKTMVAAYLIGERGTAWHAVVLGIVTTLTHTSSVIVLALVLPLFFPDVSKESQQAALGLVGGLLIAGTGLWLLMQRLAGRADHVHYDSGEGKPGWWQLILLGISGGLVPCWDAILMLGWAVSVQRLWLGLPLVLAFSAGLASVLVAVGLAVVRARETLLKRRQASEGDVSLGRWDRVLEGLGKALPLISAVLIVGIGLWLCFESAHGAHD